MGGEWGGRGVHVVESRLRQLKDIVRSNSRAKNISDQMTYDSEQYNRLKFGVTICLSHVALKTTDQLRVRGIY